MALPDAVSVLERDLREIFGARMQSLVAYGVRAAATSDAHEARAPSHAHEPVETNTLAIVESISTDDLRACAHRAAKWHDAGLGTPLLLAPHEFGRALDAFPLEFGAILADHVVVAGKNPFEGLRVDAADVRRACEVQARSHLLHLREGYVETLGRPDALAVLIVRSAPPFAALLKSVARLEGLTADDNNAVGRHAERALALPGGVLTDLVKLTAVTEIASDEAVRLFPAYLEAVERLVKYVDGWSAK